MRKGEDRVCEVSRLAAAIGASKGGTRIKVLHGCVDPRVPTVYRCDAGQPLLSGGDSEVALLV